MLRFNYQPLKLNKGRRFELSKHIFINSNLHEQKMLLATIIDDTAVLAIGSNSEEATRKIQQASNVINMRIK